MFLIIIAMIARDWLTGAEVTTQPYLLPTHLCLATATRPGCVPQTTLSHNNRVQNAVVRLIVQLGMGEHVTPQLHQLVQFVVACSLAYSVQTLYEMMNVFP